MIFTSLQNNGQNNRKIDHLWKEIVSDCTLDGKERTKLLINYSFVLNEGHTQYVTILKNNRN